MYRCACGRKSDCSVCWRSRTAVALARIPTEDMIWTLRDSILDWAFLRRVSVGVYVGVSYLKNFASAGGSSLDISLSRLSARALLRRLWLMAPRLGSISSTDDGHMVLWACPPSGGVENPNR